MAKIETDLMKEMRNLRRGISLILRRQDLILKTLVPEVRPTREEMKIIRARKEFGTEKQLFKASR